MKPEDDPTLAAFFALLGWLFLLGKAVLEWN